MIIFDIDGVIANCDHRKHFIDDRYSPPDCKECENTGIGIGGFCYCYHGHTVDIPDYEAYDEACDKDEPIIPVIQTLIALCRECICPIEIWTGRSEAVRCKTEYWINENVYPFEWNSKILKMRPIGNNEPSCDLKNRWLNEYMAYPKNDPIEMVFDAQADSIHMWKRHGIFVFDCRQG